jgi:hypothetical protein
MIPTDPVDLARIAYRAYGETTDHKNVRGEPMPAWDHLGRRIQAAWISAARAVAEAVKEAP